MATRSTASGRLPDGGRTLTYLPGLGDFDAPLKTTLAPIAGTGAITYTRAVQSYVTDYEGVLRRAISGEARFEGARRVQNLATYSQTLTNAIWTNSNTTLGTHTETVNGMPTYVLTDNATSASHSFRYTISHTLGNTYCVSAYVKAGTLSYCQLAVASVSTNYANFDLTNGTIGWQTGQAAITPVSGATGWYRISLYYTATVTSAQLTGVFMVTSPSSARAQTYSGSGSTLYITGYQIEDITGQSILAPAEYVSTNVLNAFPYHGAGVDGVKYFDTTLTGAKIPESTLKGFLNEGQRINSFLQSESMVTSWTRSGATAVASPIAVPTGMLSGCKIIPSAGTQVSQTYQSVTTSATNYTYSVYAKAGEMSFIQLCTTLTTSTGYVNFDLTNGTFNAPGTWTGKMEALPNGWYRCIAMTDTVVATTNNVVINIVSSLTSTHTEAVTGDGVGGLYLWQAQWENGTFASSPITTTTTTVTRNGDILSYNVANVISNYGAVYLEFTMGDVPSVGVDRRVFGLTANTNNRLQITGSSITTNTTIITVGNGSAVLSTNLGNVVSTNTYSKVAVKWTNGGVANLFQNGSKSPDLSSPSVAVTQIDVGNVGGAPLYGYIKNLKIWKTVIDSDALRLLTN